MAKVTWLGEDELHFTVDDEGNKEQGAGPSFTIWNGVKFPKGEPVEITSRAAIEKAKNNPFFKVEGAPGRPAKAAAKEESVTDDGAHENP